MLIVVRHGQSTGNERNLLVGRVDLPLTDHGRAQAAALAPALRGAEVVYSSPLARAHETALLAAPHVAPQVDDAFIELSYGSFEERPLADLAPSDWAAMAADHEAPVAPGGESLAAVDARVTAALDTLAQDHHDLFTDPHRHVVITTHASPVKSAVAWAMGVPGTIAWRIRSDNAALTTITWRLGRPYLLNHNVVPATSAKLEA